MRPALFICEHGKRDDEDCLPCEIFFEERMIAVAEDHLAKSKSKLARLKKQLAALSPASPTPEREP